MMNNSHSKKYIYLGHIAIAARHNFVILLYSVDYYTGIVQNEA